jgi:hypothetical protein
MDRRRFLRTLAGATVGLVLDPELALWVPGRKTYLDMGGISGLQALVDDGTTVGTYMGIDRQFDMILKEHYAPWVVDQLNTPSPFYTVNNNDAYLARYTFRNDFPRTIQEITDGPVRQTT